ncbi:MAG: hypothetical protein SFY56_04755 [Bacteroidota bacterium]|nr:hypothetical protein [Bacteroidota bacterium]
MTSAEAIINLKKYKDAEGKTYSFNGSKININKVYAAPFLLSEFNGEIYRDYVENSEDMVKLNLSSNYDIYFVDNPYDSFAGFIRLDDFIKNCTLIS